MAVNQTIDDTLGNSVTGQKPVYTPARVWNSGASCKRCEIHPELSQAFGETWTEATYMPELGAISIQFSFKGTAIYVYFITVNTLPVLKPLITTETACNFTLNGQHAGSFSYIPTKNLGLEYNVLAFSKADLPDSEHDLIISTSGVNRHIYVNFDYAIFTTDNSIVTSSQSPNISAPIFSTSTATTSTLGILNSGTITAATISTFDFPYSSTSIAPTIPASIAIDDPSILPTSTTLSSAGAETSAPGKPSSLSGSPDPGVIAGTVIGSVIAILLLVTLALCWRRRRSSSQFPATDPLNSHGKTSFTHIASRLREEGFSNDFNPSRFTASQASHPGNHAVPNLSGADMVSRWQTQGHPMPPIKDRDLAMYSAGNWGYSDTKVKS